MGGRRKQHLYGTQFDERRTKEGRGDMSVFLYNHAGFGLCCWLVPL